MAEIIWNRQAETEWRKKLQYGLDEFGQSTASQFVERTNFVVGLIRKHPLAGTPEPLLRHKKKVYRYFHLIGNLKLIYYYLESTDVIRIVDVWDTRREPSHLAKRIR